MARIANAAFSNQSAGEPRQRSKKGFAASDVSAFLNAGNNQARGGSPSAPKLRQTTVAAGVQTSPDLPPVSSEVTSQGQVDLLVKAFSQRKKTIDQRRAQPSRTGLFLGGRS